MIIIGDLENTENKREEKSKMLSSKNSYSLYHFYVFPCGTFSVLENTK